MGEPRLMIGGFIPTVPWYEGIGIDINNLHPNTYDSVNAAVVYREQLRDYTVPPEYFDKLMGIIDRKIASAAESDGRFAGALGAELKGMKANLQGQIDAHAEKKIEPKPRLIQMRPFPPDVNVMKFIRR